jgi:CspA family cold shock protein
MVGSVMENESQGTSVNGAPTFASSGSVKWFNAEKGYGFIEVPDSKNDIFLHVKELRKSGIIALNDGAPVSFTAVKGPKGLYATDIKVLPGKA